MSTIELTSKEITMIELAREKATEVEVRRQLEIKRRAIRERAEQERLVAEIANKQAELVIADTTNILFTPEGKVGLYFLLQGSAHLVLIEEHMVYSSTGYRARRNGVKYKLSNDYKNRYLKNPATVIKKITDLQVSEAVRQTARDVKRDLTRQAFKLATTLYPDHSVTTIPGVVHQNRPNMIRVTADKGVVHFTYRMVENEVVLKVDKAVQSCTRDDLAKLILGG